MRIQSVARWRVPVGFFCSLIVIWLAQPTAVSLMWGGATAAIGELLRIWAAGHLNKAREVTASGPYRWLAHPLYVGSSLMGVGLAIASANVTAAVLIVGYLMVMLGAAIQSEEAILREKFGARYDQYRGGRHVSVPRRFSLSQAIANHEQNAVIGVVVAVLLLVLKATYNGSFWRTGAGHQ